MSARRAGFTLLELLAVILIVGILAAVLVTQLGGATDTAGSVSTRNLLEQLSAIVEDYEREHGDYPPSSFGAEHGVPNEGENVGIEALVVTLFSNGWDAGGHADALEEALANTDGDSSSRSLTDFGHRQLLEIVDHWGNPVAYLHHRDYDETRRAYLVVTEEGLEETQHPTAWKNPTTGRHHKPTRFQLASAGPDGVFGTEDDITNFDR